MSKDSHVISMKSRLLDDTDDNKDIELDHLDEKQPATVHQRSAHVGSATIKASTSSSKVSSLAGDKKGEDRSLFKAEFTSKGATKPPMRLSFSRLMAQAKPERSLLIAATVALFISALLNLAIPAFVGTIIDAISDPKNGSDHDFLYDLMADIGSKFGADKEPKTVLNVSVILLMITIIFASIFTTLRSYWFTMAGERVVARLRADLFAHLLSLEIGFYDVTRTAELVNRLASDTTILKDAVTINISMGLRWAATVLFGIGYLFIISWKLTLVMLSVVPIVAVSAVFYGKRIRKLSKETQDALARATEVAEESLSHIRTVRSFSREQFQSKLYAERIQKTYELGRSIAWAFGLFAGVITFVASGAMILVLWYGASLVLEKEMSAGVLTSYVLYTLTVGIALAGLSSLFAQFMQAIGACERIFEIKDRKTLIDTETGLKLERLTGHISFRNVSFAYPARPEITVLKNVNLELRPGTVTALVGPSGQGKSTIVSLVERFYDLAEPSSVNGDILIDGHNIKQLDLSSLHRQVALVSQEPVLFATSIRENLCYGVGSEVSMSDIERACEMANARSFIESFPEKYETTVGERGVRLSGGQKQRIAIARAILLNPTVLIADEATSSLDAESEFHVQQALEPSDGGTNRSHCRTSLVDRQECASSARYSRRRCS